MSPLARADRALESLLKLVEPVAFAVVLVGGFILFVSSLIVTVDVFLRKYLLITLGGANDLSSYAFAVSMSWAVAYVMMRREHIRVDVLYPMLPRTLRAIIDTVAACMLTLMALLFAYWTTVTAHQSWKLGSVSNSDLQLPLWLPQALWAAGFVFFAAVGVLIAMKCVCSLAMGNIEGVFRRFGMISSLQEAEREIEAAAGSLEASNVTFEPAGASAPKTAGKATRD